MEAQHGGSKEVRKLNGDNSHMMGVIPSKTPHQEASPNDAVST